MEIAVSAEVTNAIIAIRPCSCGALSRRAACRDDCDRAVDERRYDDEREIDRIAEAAEWARWRADAGG